ncbi:MAG TPA: hypothetical protein VFZ09_50945 [Archangium sp.]|uniref:hypothetical protein n=1 Tax=Archangium sp. TaxID=1872627 RepID=UPI002E365A46|nr:hypothetical protein [Archangium sp.]HEX5754605.1 hypothetical protein [Archangium sp.]
MNPRRGHHLLLLSWLCLSNALVACSGEPLGDTRVGCSCVCRACTIQDRRNDDGNCTGTSVQIPSVTTCAASSSPTDISNACEDACSDIAGYQVSVCFGESCPGWFPIWASRPETCSSLGPVTSIVEGGCGEDGPMNTPTRDSASALVRSESSVAHIALGEELAAFTPAGTVSFAGGYCATPPCPVVLQGVQLGSAGAFQVGKSTVSGLGIFNTAPVQGNLSPDGSLQFFVLPPFDASATIDGHFISRRAQPTALRGHLFPDGTLRLTGQIALEGGSATFDLSTRVDDSAPIVRIDSPSRGECGHPVRLSAGQSFDPDGDALVSFEWAEEFQSGPPQPLGSGPILDITLPLGHHMLSVTVTDSRGRAMTSFTGVTIADTLPPEIRETQVTPVCLWPPAHGLAAFTVGGEVLTSVVDACDASPTVIFESVTSSQPADGTGDGSTAVDAAVLPGGESLCLRAERAGSERAGRTYRASLEVSDASGNSAHGEVLVEVPHDQRPSERCREVTPAACELAPASTSTSAPRPPETPLPPEEEGARGCQAAGGSGFGAALLAVMAVLSRGRRCGVLALVALVLSGCQGPDGGAPSAENQPLDTCLPGWWTTTAGSCRIEPACDHPSSEELRAACAASDCISVTVTGYRPASGAGGAGFYQGTAIGSESARRFCARDVFNGTWSVSSAEAISVTFGGSQQQVTARCSASSATVSGLGRRRVSEALAKALDARAASGDWNGCAY